MDYTTGQRLLIPVKDGDDAEQAVAYAIRRRAEGIAVSVCLLHVEESEESEGIGQTGLSWNGKPGVKRRREVFTTAMRLFSGLDIDVSAYIRKGSAVFTILDTAEELDCQEIVMPSPPAKVFRWLSRNTVTTLLARQRTVRVVVAKKDGTASLQ